MNLVFDKDSLDLVPFYKILKMFDTGTILSNNFNDLKTLQFSISTAKSKSGIDVTMKRDGDEIVVDITNKSNQYRVHSAVVNSEAELIYTTFCNSILGEDYSILIVENESNAITIQLEHFFYNYNKIIRYQNDRGIICKTLEISIPCNYYDL